MKRVISVFLSLTLILLVGQAYAMTWVDLLVINAGAEAGNTSGWAITGNMTALNSIVQSTSTVNPHSGNWFFASGLGTVSTMTQTFDVSGFASGIDTGAAQYDAGFWYQTEYYNGAFDKAQAAISFYDAAGNLILADTSDEFGSSAWAFEGGADAIPVGTRSLALTFTGKRYAGSYINAFFDDIYLKVGTPEVIPEPATLSLLGIGMLGLVLKRKKSAS